MTKDLSARFKAGDLMCEVGPLVDEKGGGSQDMAQVAGTNHAGIEDAIAFVETWVTTK